MSSKKLTVYQEIIVYEAPKTKVSRNKGRVKQPKYRPFTHRVYGTDPVTGMYVVQAVKSKEAAEKLAATLYESYIGEYK